MEFYNYNGEWQSSGGKPIETFPIQYIERDRGVPLEVAQEAYKEYAARYGTQQTLKQLGERGGFSSSEIAILLYQRCKRLSPE